MIDINLVPEQLRKKKKSKAFLGGMNIAPELVIGVGGGFIFLVLFSHIALEGLKFHKLSQHKQKLEEWGRVEPAKKIVEAVLQELRNLQGSQKAIEGLTGEKGISWSKKLNILSDSLPRGVWLKRISLNYDALFIDGSAISKQDDEMISVHSFASNLKHDQEFLDGFGKLELGSIQRRSIKTVEVADFLITIRLLKSEEEDGGTDE